MNTCNPITALSFKAIKLITEYKKKITFEPSAFYFQEQNSIFERIKRIIIDITKATILEGNINDDLWSELVLVMTYIKNSHLIKALDNLSPHEVHFYKQLSLTYL